MKTFKHFLDEAKIPSPTIDDLKLIIKNKKHPDHIRRYAQLHVDAIKEKSPDSLKHAREFINSVNELKEDGMGGGAIASAGPTNVVGSGAIAGSGGKGGEPGVHIKKKRNSPIILSMGKRKALE